jgi:hypothetical protein
LTPRASLVKVLGSMVWLRRSLVLIPVISFVAAALLLSCGGGGGSTSSNVSGLPISLFSLRVCAGPTASPTPTPQKTKGCNPTDTATPECTPLPTNTAGIPFTVVPMNTPFQLSAQGTYSKNPNGKKKFYLDRSGDLSLVWGIQPPGILTLVNPGEFIGVANGCVCLDAQIAPFVSCPIAVQVGSGAPCVCATPTTTPSPGGPSVALCPGPIPTPTKTRTPKPGQTPTPTPTCAVP